MSIALHWSQTSSSATHHYLGRPRPSASGGVDASGQDWFGTWTSRTSVWLLVAALLVAPSAGLLAEEAAAHPSEAYLYLPPDIESRVVFYHSFERGVKQPEIDLLRAKISCGKMELADGFAGRGLKCSNREVAKNPLRVHSQALSAHRPLTVMVWWRLDAPMQDATCYHLIRLGGRGYVAAFVRGKGKWCALTRPTFVFQVYNFAGIANRNNPWTGHAWVEPGTWHHVALTVATASDIRVYWDGRQRIRHGIKGRSFRKGDTSSLDLGASWLFHPTTIDEVVVLDRVLDERDVRSYVEVTRRLAEISAPVRVP